MFSCDRAQGFMNRVFSHPDDGHESLSSPELKFLKEHLSKCSSCSEHYKNELDRWTKAWRERFAWMNEVLGNEGCSIDKPE